MQIDFFNKECQKSTHKDKFGICDDVDLNAKTPAYLDFENTNDWLVKVVNSSSQEIVFTAIDHCILKYDRTIDNPSRCDAMLIYENSIIFVELKNKLKKPAQIAQLENTIRLFFENNIDRTFSKKEAYLSNKKKTVFLSQDTKEKFIQENNGFRLYFSTVITIE
jgi:hypothetical protein